MWNTEQVWIITVRHFQVKWFVISQVLEPNNWHLLVFWNTKCMKMIIKESFMLRAWAQQQGEYALFYRTLGFPWQCAYCEIHKIFNPTALNPICTANLTHDLNLDAFSYNFRAVHFIQGCCFNGTILRISLVTPNGTGLLSATFWPKILTSLTLWCDNTEVLTLILKSLCFSSNVMDQK